MTETLPYIADSYPSSNSDASALRLILALRPEWKETAEYIKFDRFTDGITNTLLKATNNAPARSLQEADCDAVLLRAYGQGSDILIDREKERRCHLLLAQHNLAPALLARFKNGLLYKYIQGTPCRPDDFRRKDVWQAIARRLGEWHSRLPISSISSIATLNGNGHPANETNYPSTNGINGKTKCDVSGLTVGKPTPNVWTITQKWIDALPGATDAERARKEELQAELRWLVKEVGDVRGHDGELFVFAHTDLLSGNVIIEPNNEIGDPINSSKQLSVSFIDYEYAVPAPASFDIANHFSEWGGFDCDHSLLPTRTQRRDFIEHYLQSYNTFRSQTTSETDIDTVFAQVDRLRGVPGFYWGVWARVQAEISQIDFDYANYAEIRLGEYHAWKAENDGSRKRNETEQCLRERRWAQES